MVLASKLHHAPLSVVRADARAPADPRTRAEYAAMADVDLLHHVLARRELAWDVFFKRFRGLILSCAMKIGSRSGVRMTGDDLMDVLGEVALNLVAHDFRKLRLYRTDGGCSVSSWIGVIATTTTRDYLRRARRQRVELSSDEELEHLSCPSLGPEEALIDRERRGFVDKTLAQLSKRDQDFVQLYFAEARSPEAIAEEMGVSLATVYSKKAKIKTRLTSLAKELVD